MKISHCLALYSALLVAGAFASSSTLGAAAGRDVLADTFHNDGRGTAKLVFPARGQGVLGKGKEAADAFLKARQADFKLPADLSNLQFVTARESLVGTHYRYQQVLNGVPVQGADVVVSIHRDSGEVYQAYNNSYPVEAAPELLAKNLIGTEQALDVAWNHLRVHGKLLEGLRSTLVYLPQGNNFRLVYKTLVSVEEPFGYWEHMVDAFSGEVVSVRDTAVNLKRTRESLPDFGAYTGPVWSRTEATQEWAETEARQSAPPPPEKGLFDGTGRVFDADPRTYLNNPSLVDSSTASAFTSAYVTRTLRDINESGGVYSLNGPYVAIINFEAPNTAPSTTLNGNWNFSRGNNAFNDAMTYFHIDQNQRYLQSLGYTGPRAIQNVPIGTDSDGLSGADNSHYIPSANRLAFGHGGVDDNEDVDVILHEYGHAITYGIVPSWGGGDTGAIGEGFGDYWGGSYSSTTVNGTLFHPEWAFSWDGHTADSWPGRWLDKTTLTYDHSISYGAHQTIGGISDYSDQLWSAPLWAAFQTLRAMGYPRTAIDSIIIESFFGIGGAPKMRDLAYATINAATTLFPSTPAYADVFTEKFRAQQILPQPPIPNPILIYPVGGETLTTGTVVQVQWNRNGAPAAAAARLQYLGPAANNFSDNMETGGTLWMTTHGAGASDWVLDTSSYHTFSHSFFAAGQDDVSDAFLMSPQLTIQSGAQLTFWHRWDLENTYDGGVVEISINGGSTWSDIGVLATLNGYNATISTSYGSPIGGRGAFSGIYSWRQTTIPLSAYAGTTAYIRFRAAYDSSVPNLGWWVDDVSISGISYRPWFTIGTSAAGASTYNWPLPMVTGSDYVLRIQQFAAGYIDSAWVQSAPFTLGASVPRPFIQSIAPNGGGVRITWTTVSGATYRLQYKNNLTDLNWTPLTPDVVANGATSYKDDAPLISRRFYQVIVP